MFVVLDTNVVVSAFWNKLDGGNASSILLMCINKQIQIVYSSAILNEYSEVLRGPKFSFLNSDVDRFIASIKNIGINVDALIESRSVPKCTDIDDQIFFNASFAADAILVTGNLKDFPKSNRVLKPKEFLETLNFDV